MHYEGEGLVGRVEERLGLELETAIFLWGGAFVSFWFGFPAFALNLFISLPPRRFSKARWTWARNCHLSFSGGADSELGSKDILFEIQKNQDDKDDKENSRILNQYLLTYVDSWTAEHSNRL